MMHRFKLAMALGHLGRATAVLAALYLLGALLAVTVLQPVRVRVAWEQIDPEVLGFFFAGTGLWVLVMAAVTVAGASIADAGSTAWSRANAGVGTVSVAMLSTLFLQLPWAGLVADFATRPQLGSDAVFLGAMVGAALLGAVALSALARRALQPRLSG